MRIGVQAPGIKSSFKVFDQGKRVPKLLCAFTRSLWIKPIASQLAIFTLISVGSEGSATQCLDLRFEKSLERFKILIKILEILQKFQDCEKILEDCRDLKEYLLIYLNAGCRLALLPPTIPIRTLSTYSYNNVS